MLNGDISNECGLLIGFRLEDCILHYKQSSILDRTLNLFGGKESRATVDFTVRNVMIDIVNNTPMNVCIVVLDENYNDNLLKILDLHGVPYGSIFNVPKEVSISTALISGVLSYYVDTDERRRMNVSTKDFCLDLNGAMNLTRKLTKGYRG